MTIYDMLVRSAAGTPGAPLIGYREQTYSYAQVQALVDGCAAGLAALRLRKRARVAVLLPNCPPFIIAYFAINRLGATVVPLNVLYRPDEARFILADSEAEAIITAEPFRPLVAALRPHLPRLQHVVMVTDGDVAGDEVDFRTLCRHAPHAAPAQSERETAVILYTSGTTGRPKGAMLTNANLIANAHSCSGVLDVTPGDCLLSALPLFHAFAATVTMLLPILVGGRIHLTERFVPAHTLQLLEDAGVTIFAGVPSMFGLMLQIPRDHRPSLAALRTCISGGAPLPPDVWTAFEAAFDVRMAEGYGLTEAAPVVSVNPPLGLRKVGSIGPAIPDVALKLIDARGRAVPDGEIGELCVRGPNVMKGYLNRRAETKDVLRRGWLHTGDLARRDEDGYLFIVGRKKELIIVGGLNVYPGEVERVLVEHPAVLEVAAYGVSDPSRGEAVWASVVLRPDSAATEKELQALCREKLANYKVPRGIDIRTELPKNALGKVMRHLLSQEIVARQSRPTPV